MKTNTRAISLLVSYGFVFFLDPDFAAPLCIAAPLFGFTVLYRHGIHTVDFASLIGLASVVCATIALWKYDDRRFTYACRIGLGISAALFVVSSRPLVYSALTAIPFVIFVSWPDKKRLSTVAGPISITKAPVRHG